jgi:hypothetical protein
MIPLHRLERRWTFDPARPAVQRTGHRLCGHERGPARKGDSSLFAVSSEEKPKCRKECGGKQGQTQGAKEGPRSTVAAIFGNFFPGSSLPG